MRVSCVVLLVCSGLAASCNPIPESATPGTSSGIASGAALSQAAHDIALTSETMAVSARVAAGATLASILRAENVAAADTTRLIELVASVFDPRKVRADQLYRLERALDGSFRKFEYEIDGDRFLRVRRAGPNVNPDANLGGSLGKRLTFGPGASSAVSDGALEATILPIPKTRVIEHIAGRIDRASSLVEAMHAMGETVDLTLAISEILGGEIDFSTAVRPGDRFDVRVEKQFRDDSGGRNEVFAGYGRVQAVEFVNAGRRMRAVRFTPQGGQPGYYDEHGVSVKRFFLASPLKFQPVVTSPFSPSRFHPVLMEYRAHLGVDYRAPEGAPVVAVADGVVVAAGPAGDAGRRVHLHHANGFETEYLHLSSISVRPGERVRQGELIGRVGSSGLATGPHLDYRLAKNGVFVNPVNASRAAPPAEPVPPEDMTAFIAVRDRAFPAEAGSDGFATGPYSSRR